MAQTPAAPGGAAASKSGLRALRGRPDTEHEMSFNRLAFALIISVFLVLDDAPAQTVEVVGAYWLVALALFVHILVRPAKNNARRITALILDMGFLSYELHVGGEVTSVLAPIYLWVILGNGFRFGVAWLRGAQAMAILGFTAVIVFTPFWWNQIHLSTGFLLGLIAIPAYASTLIRKLSAAKAQAEAASQAKSLFLASVSHELRTPLNAIIGMGGLLQQSKLDSDQREMARTVADAGRNLLDLIDSVLDFSRIEAGRMPVTRAAFALPALLDEVHRMLAGEAARKGLRFTFHATARTPQRIVGDVALTREILLNLAANAVKFTAQGSVVVAVDAVPADGQAVLRFEVTDTGIGIAAEAQARIFEAFSQADGSIINRFGGTGLGLAICRRTVALLGGEIGVQSVEGEGSTFWCTLPLEAAAPSTASGFLPEAVLLAPDAAARAEGWRRQSPNLRLRPATSLPEAVAALAALPQGAPRLLVAHAGALGMAPDALGEALEVLDPPGAWRSIVISGGKSPGLPPYPLRRAFTTVLPDTAEPPAVELALRLAAGGPERAATLAEPRPAPRRPLAVLVADDNRVNLRVVAKILESAGHLPTLVDDGEEALEALEQQNFDLVLMDLNMPRLDGIEAAKLYRVQAMGRRAVPWLALTADATEEARRRCDEAGFLACLVKPLTPEALLTAIERVPLADPDAAPGGFGVAAIASHPRFRATGAVLVDQRALDELEVLGGKDFVEGVVADFLEDAELVISELTEAAAALDSPTFRAKAHALHSAAANVGARALCEICMLCRNVGPEELRERGGAIVGRLASELARARPLLRREPPDQGAVEGA